MPALYVLHHDDLDVADVESFEGIPITTVERTLRDCIAAGSRHELLEQAIANAAERRAIPAATALDLRHALASKGRTV